MIELAIEKNGQEVVEQVPKTRENLKQRAYLNGLTSLIDFAAVQVTGLVVSPIIVNGLGGAMYGVWKVIAQLTGYATLADSRATQVLKWTVAAKRDVAGDEELRSDVSSAFFVTAFILPFILIAGAILSWYAPFIAGADAAYYDHVRITCALLVFSLVISRVFDLFEAVLRGMNLGFKRMGLRSAIIIGGGALKVLVIMKGYGLIGLSVVQIIITILTGLSFYIIVKRSVGWFGFGNTNFKKVTQFAKLSGWNMANTTTDTILTSSDKVLLGFVAGPLAVSHYALSAFLPLAVQGFLFRVIIGAVPGIGKLFGLKEYSRIHKVWDSMNGLIFLLTTATGVTVILFNKPFLTAWVGEEFFAGNITTLLLVVMIMQDTFIKHDGYIINATLDLKRKVYLTAASSALFVTLGFILVDQLGIAGLCLALIGAKFLLFVGQRSLLKRKIQQQRMPVSFSRLQPVLMCCVMLLLAFYLTDSFDSLDIPQMLMLAPLVFVGSLFLFYVFGLRTKQRSELVKIVSSIRFFKSRRQ